MDWVSIVLGSVFVLFLLLGGILGLLVSHVLAPAPMVARATFECPFRKQKVAVAFATSSGSEHPDDVTWCSAFEHPENVTCKKACLEMAETLWAPSPMVPRYSLISDDVTYR